MKLKSFRVPSMLLEKAWEKAESEGYCSMSELIRSLLREYLHPKPSEINTKITNEKDLETIILQNQRTEKELSILMEKISDVYQNQNPAFFGGAKLTDRIEQALENRNLSVLEISQDLSEDPELLLLILQHMKQEGRVTMTKKQRWKNT